MATVPSTPSSKGARAGQFTVRGTMQPNINSTVKAGQVPVRSTTEGDRGGDLNARGCVSPLGNADLGYSTNNSQGEERRERPKGSY